MERWVEIYDELFHQHRDAGGPNATDYISDGASEILEAACKRIAELEKLVEEAWREGLRDGRAGYDSDDWILSASKEKLEKLGEGE